MTGFSNINGSLFDWLNESAGHIDPVDDSMVWIARFGVFAVLAIVAVSWFIRTCPAEERRLAAYTAAASLAIALAVALIVQHFYVHQRPFVVRGDVVLLMQHPADPSFPSEHATAAFAMASALGLYRPRLGLLAIACAAMVAISRVYVGVHYPADVAAGAAIGVLSSLALFWARPLLRWLDARTIARFAPAILR